jgi:arsenite methyltransferase
MECGFYLDNPSQWWHIVSNSGFRGLVNKLSPAELNQFKAEHLSEIGQLASDRGIWLEMSVLYTMGMKYGGTQAQIITLDRQLP